MDQLIGPLMVLFGLGIVVAWVVWMVRVATKTTPWGIRRHEEEIRREWNQENERRRLNPNSASRSYFAQRGRRGRW